MFKESDSYQRGKWVKTSVRLPKNQGIKITLTDNHHLGLAAYVDDEWIQFLPSYLGEVAQWCEFLDDGGQEIDCSINEPEPELHGGV